MNQKLNSTNHNDFSTMPSEGDKMKQQSEGCHHSKAELLAKMFPERSVHDIHVILEKNGRIIETAEWELLADRDRRIKLQHCPSSGYWKYVDR